MKGVGRENANMWKGLILVFLGFLPSVVGAQPSWYRGNVHVHTNQSDGTSAPAEVVEWYRTHGYSFLVLTDHDVQSVTPELLERFHSPGSFLLLPGVEVTDRVDGRPVHLNGLGVEHAVRPQGGPDVTSVIDRDIAAIERAGGVAVLNHPNGLLSAALEAEEIAASEVGLFEVCCADYLGGSGHPSTDQIWDDLLTGGRLVFGVAADDAHDFGPDSRDPGSAWIMVRAAELTGRAILSGIQAGDFYSTTGVTLTAVRPLADGLCLEIAEYDSYGFRTEFIGPGGRVLRSDETREPCFSRSNPPSYVRARVQRSDGAVAWVQPVIFAALGKNDG
jgi:hypothetical protein